MHYKGLIVEFEPPSKVKEPLQILKNAGRFIRWENAKSKTLLLSKINGLIPKDICFSPGSPDLRVRHIVKDGIHYYIIFNEGQNALEFRFTVRAKGQRYLLDPQTGQCKAINQNKSLHMKPYELKVLGMMSS